MSKRKVARIAAVVTTLAATMALISAAVMSTGAYFTDSHGGAISGNLGTVAISTSGGGGGNGLDFNFANLMPGETQTQTVNVQNTGTGNEDIYLAFSNDNYEWSAVNDLGQYGTFVINGLTFDNLNNRYAATNSGVPGTGTGTGGPCGTPRIPVNYLPHVIKIGTLTSGQTYSFNISFTFNACLSSGQGASLWGTAPGDFTPQIGPGPLHYAVAAFQPGVDPNDQMNGAGRIAPLVLPLTTPYDDTYTPKATFQ